MGEFAFPDKVHFNASVVNACEAAGQTTDKDDWETGELVD